MRAVHSRIGALALACFLAGVGGQAGATGLQVAPTMLSLSAAHSAHGHGLSNTGAEPMHAPVRVYAWAQEGGEDRLTPSRALIASPPMVQLEAGARQLVRVIRAGAPPAATEEAFRLIVDELPLDAPVAGGADGAPATDATALKFVLRYSVPIFVEPATPGSPELAGKFLGGEQPLLEVRNTGTRHAQLATLAIDAPGHREELVPGLLGYVLAGQTMRWPLKISSVELARGGNLQVKVNGEPAEQILAQIKPAR
jgi:fimbrial chaperone protein